jgi:hypothetical protein
MTYSVLIDGSGPAWRYSPIPDDQVAPDVTQRDQFNNDSVELKQAIVREGTQNSTDQPSGADPVHIRFAIRTLSDSEATELQELMEPLIPHCETCGLDLSGVFDKPARVLSIEDFNTTGLVGAIDRHDDGNFAGFWRKHGGSNKDPSKGGSHGLGKLVFSASSRMGAIFGLTITEGGKPWLMGQSILNNHKIGEKRLPAHGFWTNTPPGSIQLPDSDAERIAAATDLFGWQRTNETGLSIAVPYPLASISEDALSAAVVTNYFFPIIAGSLIVTVGDQTIDASNLFEVADAHPDISDEERGHLDFVRSVAAAAKAEPDFVLDQFPGDRRLTQEDFDEDLLKKVRDKFAAGELVSIRLPIKVKPKHAPDEMTSVDLYLSEKPDDAHPWALFARNSLVLPGEQKDAFREAAFGALIATDSGIVRLLRDAENPAHTKWNAREKVRKNWRNGEATVRDIRFCLRDLHRIITAEARQEYRDLLIDVLSIKDPEGKKRKGKRNKTPPPTPPKPTPRVVQETRIENGVRLSGGPGAGTKAYPIRLRVRLAYDMLTGNPFKAHSPLDFDLTKKAISTSLTNAAIRTSRPNALLIEVTDKDFKIDITGFDPNRDLIVDPKVV